MLGGGNHESLLIIGIECFSGFTIRRLREGADGDTPSVHSYCNDNFSSTSFHLYQDNHSGGYHNHRPSAPSGGFHNNDNN